METEGHEEDDQQERKGDEVEAHARIGRGPRWRQRRRRRRIRRGKDTRPWNSGTFHANCNRTCSYDNRIHDPPTVDPRKPYETSLKAGEGGWRRAHEC